MSDLDTLAQLPVSEWSLTGVVAAVWFPLLMLFSAWGLLLLIQDRRLQWRSTQHRLRVQRDTAARREKTERSRRDLAASVAAYRAKRAAHRDASNASQKL